MNISVAIATWNRSTQLDKTLAALTTLRTPPGLSWELMVCDNNSTDATRRVVESYADRLPVTYLFEPKQGKSFALNRLIDQTTGQWLVFIDDDVRVDPGWLEAYAAGFERYPDAACFGGPVLPWLDRPAAGHRAYIIEHYPGVYALVRCSQDTPMALPDTLAYGPNMALRRDALPAEGYDTSKGMFAGQRVSGEDAGIVRTMLDQGHTGWLLADAKVEHYIPPDNLGLKRFCQWQAGIGREWVLDRGKPTPGRFGVAWWAWREFVRRTVRAVMRWRPWPSQGFYEALTAASQYWGYLSASRA